MSKKKVSRPYWIFGVLAVIIILAIGVSNGWFNFVININQPDQHLAVTPTPQAPVYNSCSQVCSNQGFSKYYTFNTACQPGESKVTYGYANQAPLLTCCCWNEAPQPTDKYVCCQAMGVKSCYLNSCPPAGIKLGTYDTLAICQSNCKTTGTCTETDGGDVPTVPGTTRGSDGIARMDVCIDSTSLTEYWCLPDGTWQGGRHSCEPGQTCLSSRSGGYCKTKVWNAGDNVMTGGGSGSTVGSQEGFAELDLGDYGLATGGNCRLGAELHVEWSYGNDKCVGIPGAEGMKWEFYDSSGLEYSRQDFNPTSWTAILEPESHTLSWDGHTAWRAYARHYPGNLPDCIINYQYTARVYIYDCV